MGVTVSFETGSYQLDLNGKGALDGVAKWMQANPDRSIKLQGYADPTGTTDENMALSEERADSVKAYLVATGIDPARITTMGRGEVTAQPTPLPASGRTVTFLGCTGPAVATAEPAPMPEAAAPVEPVPSPAETEPVPNVAPMNAAPAPAYEAGAYAPYGSRFGFAMIVGGGYTDFSNSNARSLTSAGGSWDARVIGGTRSFVGFEAAYVGTANSIHTLFGTNNSTLISNGLEGALRINVPIALREHLLEPFVFGGVGWAHYSISNNNNLATSDFATATDDVMTVPLGTGFAYTYRALTLDARVSWTPTYYNNLLNTTSGSNRLDHWGAGGHLGVAF
jgi:hypothetical protein